MEAEERAMEVWCEADLAVAGGNVIAHRARIAEAIRAAERETIERCAVIAGAAIYQHPDDGIPVLTEEAKSLAGQIASHIRDLKVKEDGDGRSENT